MGLRLLVSRQQRHTADMMQQLPCPVFLAGSLLSGVAWPARQWEREEDELRVSLQCLRKGTSSRLLRAIEILVVLGSSTNQLVGDQPTSHPLNGVGWSDQPTKTNWLVWTSRTYPAYTGLMVPLLPGS